VIKDHIKGKICQLLIIFILCGLLIPMSVSAQCEDCDDKNPCTKDLCNGTKCVHIPQSCFGGSFITYANPGQSSNGSMPMNASGYNLSAIQQSERGSVIQTPLICDDHNPCTIDYSGPAGCINEPVNCDDGNPLTTDYCTATGCVHDGANCDDGNPCTNDYPGLTGCVHDPVSCDDASEEVRSYCSCPSARVAENLNYPETQAEIAFGVFLNPDKDDADNSAQETDASAIATKDPLAPMMDNLAGAPMDNLAGAPMDNLAGAPMDNLAGAPMDNLTGAPMDNLAGAPMDNLTGAPMDNLTDPLKSKINALVNNASECDDGDPCTDDHFVHGKCKHYLKTCNDNIPSNFDYCYEGECIHSPINCDDGDKCTIDSYNGTACVYRPVNCDDGNPCTEDSCNSLAGCQNMEINRDNDYCTVECENGKPVFKPLICDDANPCTRDYCDKSRGCVHVPICGPFHYWFPYRHYLPMDYYYPYIYYPAKYYYPYSATPVIAAPTVAAPTVAAASTTGTSSPPPTKTYTISAGKVITLPWNKTVTALDTLQVENGIALSSESGIRFARQMGSSKVYQLSDSQNITDRAEMVGLSWPVGGIPFTLTLIQPNGTTLSVQDGDKDALHITGTNYDYYFLRNPVKGYWTAVVKPEQSSASGIGFSLISGLVEGIVPP